ncbi:MAG TPA: AAA family ATPase [Actinomycetota bacterium]|nr:AAA family ATPase [Actinomycetota bacterium]
MPLQNRLKIWVPRILAVVLAYLAYLWLFETHATCVSVCTAGEANAAIGHFFQRQEGVIFIMLALSCAALLEIGLMLWLLSRGRTYTVFPYEYDVTFDDVKGQAPVVESVQEVVKLFRGFREFRELGGYPPHGILFEGPPGTGKTLMAKAVAGTVGVPFIYTSATSFANMFMGVGNMRVMMLFRKAKKYVKRYDGAVIFIDEIDALGSRGAGVSSASTPVEEPRAGLWGRVDRFMSPGGGLGAGIVNELLVQMDGLVMPKGIMRNVRRYLRMKPKVPSYNILIVAATNRAQVLDPALLRPGRFDRKIHVGLPDKEGRIDIIDYYLGKVKHAPIDIGKFAQMTIGYSPARVKNIVNEALIVALQDGRDALTWEDIWQAKLIDEIGLKQPVKYTEREKVMTAVHEAGHAVAAHELRSEDMRIQVITIIKRQEALGLVHSMELEEHFSATKESLLTDLKVSLAGMAAEEIWFGTSTSGVAGDLQTATRVALQYLGVYGMGDQLISYTVIPNGVTGDPQGAAFMLGQKEIRAEVDALLRRCKDEVSEILRNRRVAVERIRDELLDREELVGDQLESLMSEIFPDKVAARTAKQLPPGAIL